MTRILNYKINFKYVSVLIFISVLGTYFLVSYFNSSDVSVSTVDSTASYKVKRLDGYKYIKPILFVDSESESSEMASMKSEIVNIIEAFKQQNILKSASVYIKDYNSNDWTVINPDEKFKPGSLLKIPELIAFIKMNEKHPGLLDKKYTFNKVYAGNKQVVFKSKSIQFGQSYTVRELLKYMIVYSDNNATYMLNEIIDVTMFKKVFTDLGLAEPDWNATDYFVTSSEISLFMRTLFNASYLTIEDSEFAASLLSNSDFNQGIVAALPKSTRFSHKFGEAGDAVEKQLSETAIIYTKDRTYLITIMTKGTDFKKLPEVLKQISSLVYRDMVSTSLDTL